MGARIGARIRNQRIFFRDIGLEAAADLFSRFDFIPKSYLIPRRNKAGIGVIGMAWPLPPVMHLRANVLVVESLNPGHVRAGNWLESDGPRVVHQLIGSPNSRNHA